MLWYRRVQNLRIDKKRETVQSWVQFHQCFTSSFYARRSQKCKKYSQAVGIFAHLGFGHVKALCKTLMKLTPALKVLTTLPSKSRKKVGKFSVQQWTRVGSAILDYVRLKKVWVSSFTTGISDNYYNLKQNNSDISSTCSIIHILFCNCIK